MATMQEVGAAAVQQKQAILDLLERIAAALKAAATSVPDAVVEAFNTNTAAITAILNTPLPDPIPVPTPLPEPEPVPLPSKGRKP